MSADGRRGQRDVGEEQQQLIGSAAKPDEAVVSIRRCGGVVLGIDRKGDDGQFRTLRPGGRIPQQGGAELQHPTYRALVELGKALRTAVLARYLHRMELRREIHEGLNVVENWNSANDFILYGRGGEIATNRLEDQEATMLSLHLLQNCMIYVNTLMIQRVLGEPAWMVRMEPSERRGLTPVAWGHVNPYGTFRLDMTVRLLLDPPALDTASGQLLF